MGHKTRLLIIDDDILLNHPVLVKPVDAGEIMAKVREILAR